MASKRRIKRLVRQRISNTFEKTIPPGSSPGQFTIPEDASKPKIRLYSYDSDLIEEKEYQNVTAAIDKIHSEHERCHWLEIKGFGDRTLFETICTRFNIHPLEMEDVTNLYQRPKQEEHANHIFFISRMLKQSPDNLLQNDQLSVFCGVNYVITIQDKEDDLFEPLRKRLRSGRGQMRKSGPGYLAYAINDAIVDNYFPILERTGELLDELEDELLANVAKQSMQKIQEYKRELIVFRRAAFAERDKINDMLRSNNDFINAETKVYLKDTYDHIIQVLDLVDSYKEITASLMDIYLSSISNRLNQVMKVMTVFSAVFMPLTFIAGVYGMNFARVDPETGKYLPYNMPELYWPNGYIAIIASMILVVVLELWWFIRKGWLFKD